MVSVEFSGFSGGFRGVSGGFLRAHKNTLFALEVPGSLGVLRGTSIAYQGISEGSGGLRDVLAAPGDFRRFLEGLGHFKVFQGRFR